MAKVLVIEDAEPIRTAVGQALSGAGHQVRACATALSGLHETGWPPDLVLLDLGLPDLDGAELLALIRAVSQVPVIVLTARDEDDLIVRLLRSGADDYLVKPISSAQLIARVEAILRRVGGLHGPLVVGGLSIDQQARQAELDGVPLKLKRREFDLLAYLAERAGTVVSRRELLAEVWRSPYGGGDETIDVHVSWLRRKLGETAQAPRYLHTVRGVGVKLVAPE